MDAPPITTDRRYNQEFRGFFGEFGTGADSQIIFIQSAITPAQLSKLTLISEIEGSETWSVRDLFQREVDDKRVTKAILPYFRDHERVKFFNPLTLSVLPVDPTTTEILREPPELIEHSLDFEGRSWNCLEADGYYRYRWIPDRPHYAVLDWNDDRVKVVAIDGQHRLSALKRLKRDPAEKDQFMSWTIPVVTFAVRPLPGAKGPQNSLDIVRSIFIYINKEAREPSEARQILLSDESINNICTQEILEYAHSNDVASPEARDRAKVPLLLFDWRGQEEEGRPQVAPASLRSIVEVRDWLEHYILGQDFSVDQKVALGVAPNSSLAPVFKNGQLPLAKADDVREVFRQTVLPGVVYVLEKFEPYQKYIASLRELEAQWTARSDISRHAFHELRFGSHNAPKEQEREVAQERERIVRKADELKTQLLEMLRLDIGMRGVMSAVGILRPWYNKSRQKTVPYREYAEWFTDALNQVHADRWFDWRESKTQEVLLYLYKDRADRVVNYRFSHVGSALGPLMALLVASYGHRDSEHPGRSVYDELQEELMEALEGTLLKGYKREVRTELKKTLPTKSEEYKQRLKKEAEALKEAHVRRIEEEVGKILTS
jgi:hypothetical protein